MAESLEQFVQQQLQSGKYQSYDELVQAGLKLLQEHEEELDRVADALRPALQDYLCGDRGEEVDIDAIKAAGRELLAPVYGWFTEGFDMADLQEAKALLEALA